MWKLFIFGEGQSILIDARHYDAAQRIARLGEREIMKISMLNENGDRLWQQIVPSQPHDYKVQCGLRKLVMFQSQCQQAAGSCTFRCKIFSHGKKETFSLAEIPQFQVLQWTVVANTNLEGMSTAVHNFSEFQYYADNICPPCKI